MRVALLTSGEVVEAVGLARAWAGDGAGVTLVLLDGAAGHARAGHADAPAVSALADAGVDVRAHDTALRRRGIRPGALAPGVKVCDLDEVADLLADDPDRVMWL